jgi:hypothetical protein
MKFKVKISIKPSRSAFHWKPYVVADSSDSTMFNGRGYLWMWWLIHF